MDLENQEILETNEVLEETVETTEETAEIIEETAEITEEVLSEPIETEEEEFDFVEEEEVKSGNKIASAVIAVVLCALMLVVGVAGAVLGFVYAKPKYEEMAETVKGDMAGYGYFYALYEVFKDDEQYGQVYAMQAQNAITAMETDTKKAEQMLDYMYILFLATGVMTALGAVGTVRSVRDLINRTKSEKFVQENCEGYLEGLAEKIAGENDEGYQNQFDFETEEENVTDTENIIADQPEIYPIEETETAPTEEPEQE